MDVLIVGSGPAGMLTAAQLAAFPDITTRIVERRGGRLEIGQADGIQARSVETFQAFGFAERIIAEAYRITAMAFWRPDPENPTNIVRAAAPDDTTGISEFPHLIVNQARVLDYFAEVMAYLADAHEARLRLGLPDTSVAEAGDHPVAVTLVRSAGPDEGIERIVHAKYVVGATGRAARSAHRSAAPWPRPRQPCVGRHGCPGRPPTSPTSAPNAPSSPDDGGNILLIPREGGPLFRMYVDLGVVPEGDNGAVRNTSMEEIVAKANEILHPYTLDVSNVAWNSVYEVGHRLTDRFDDVLPGPARHAHAAGLHHRRRLPHAQRQGRPGHERLHAGRF